MFKDERRALGKQPNVPEASAAINSSLQEDPMSRCLNQLPSLSRSRTTMRTY